MNIPPVGNPDELEAEIKLVPAQLREDAIQESWLAHLSGGDPIAAITAFRVGESRNRKRAVQIELSEDGEIIQSPRRADQFRPSPIGYAKERQTENRIAA